MASLSLKNVTKKYPNGFVAVKDFNLEIADKEKEFNMEESRKWCTFLVKSRHMMVKCQLRTIRLILRIHHKSCEFSYVF